MRPLTTASALGFALLSAGALHAQPAPFYDVSPSLASLRPAARQALGPSGVGPLDSLPGYNLTLTVQPAARTFALHEEIYFTNTERAPMREVVLRLYANAVRPPARRPGEPAWAPPVRFTRGACVATTCAVSAESPSVIVVRPGAPLAPGARLRVTLDLEATLPEIAAGRTGLMAQGMESLSALSAGESGGDYGLLAVGDGVVSMANFYPVLARRVDGRWERTDGGAVGDLGSDDLSNVHALIDLPSGYTLATTGTLLRRAEAAGRQRVEVGAAVVRDFAVMAGATLEVATRRVGDVEVRSIFQRQHREAGQRVLDVAARSLEVFQRRFGPYPYVDLDVVEAPLVGGAGGVEFPGLVTVASMFYGDAPSVPTRVGAPPGGGLGDLGGLLSALGGGGGASAMLGQMLPSMLEFVTAHEVAHQWWHALVGSDSRAHPFVDESLAQWSAALYLEERYGAERSRRDADMQIKMNYQFMRTLGQADAAVDRPASAFATPVAYAGLVYGKGPYLYNAWRTAAGDPVFWRAMQRYVTTWRFRTAPATGFLDALVAEDRAHAARYRTLARRWLNEAHGDEDLGQMDLGALVGNMLGGPGGQASPEMQDALRMLGPLLQGLGRQGGGSGAPSRPATPGADVSPQQLQELLNGVMQQLETQ